MLGMATFFAFSKLWEGPRPCVITSVNDDTSVNAVVTLCPVRDESLVNLTSPQQPRWHCDLRGVPLMAKTDNADAPALRVEHWHDPVLIALSNSGVALAQKEFEVVQFQHRQG